MDFLKNARKVVTGLKKAISSLDLNLDKQFDQIDFIGLITKNNSSSRNAQQSTLKITRLVVWNYKKGTQSVKVLLNRCPYIY